MPNSAAYADAYNARMDDAAALTEMARDFTNSAACFALAANLATENVEDEAVIHFNERDAVVRVVAADGTHIVPALSHMAYPAVVALHVRDDDRTDDGGALVKVGDVYGWADAALAAAI